MCSLPYFIPEAANDFTQMCIRHFPILPSCTGRVAGVYNKGIVYIVYMHLHCIHMYTYIVYIHLHCIHTLTLYTYAYIFYIHLQLYTTRALFYPNNFLETFPSGQLQHLSAHVQSCGVSSRTQQPKTFADIAATFVSSHSQSTAGLLINNIPQLLLQVHVQVRPNILLLPSQEAV